MGLAYWEGYMWGNWVDKNKVADFPAAAPVFLLFATGFLVFVLLLINLMKD